MCQYNKYAYYMIYMCVCARLCINNYAYNIEMFTYAAYIL